MIPHRPKGRVSNQGNQNRQCPAQGQAQPDDPPTITCSPTRAPADIAKDIQRRFLPLYRESLAEMLERVADLERRHYAMLDAMDALSETMEIPINEAHPNSLRLWGGRSLLVNK